MTDDYDEPLTPDHPDVIWTQNNSITIGANHDHTEVHLPPESAPIQSAPVVNIVAADNIEGILWQHGYSTEWSTYTDILNVERYTLRCGSSSPIAYCYSVCFADGRHGIKDAYRDDVRSHHRGANYTVKRGFHR